MRSLNRDTSRSLSQINDNKVRKKKRVSEVSIAVEEWKTLVQKEEKVWKKHHLWQRKYRWSQMIVEV